MGQQEDSVGLSDPHGRRKVTHKLSSNQHMCYDIGVHTDTIKKTAQNKNVKGGTFSVCALFHSGDFHCWHLPKRQTERKVSGNRKVPSEVQRCMGPALTLARPMAWLVTSGSRYIWATATVSCSYWTCLSGPGEYIHRFVLSFLR